MRDATLKGLWKTILQSLRWLDIRIQYGIRKPHGMTRYEVFERLGWDGFTHARQSKGFPEPMRIKPQSLMEQELVEWFPLVSTISIYDGSFDERGAELS